MYMCACISLLSIKVCLITIYSHIVNCYGDKVMVPLKTLVQHTCTKVPDKAEYRNKMAQVRTNGLLYGIYLRIVLMIDG